MYPIFCPLVYMHIFVKCTVRVKYCDIRTPIASESAHVNDTTAKKQL